MVSSHKAVPLSECCKAGVDQTGRPPLLPPLEIKTYREVIGTLHDLSPVISHKPEVRKGGLEDEGEWHALCCGWVSGKAC